MSIFLLYSIIQFEDPQTERQEFFFNVYWYLHESWGYCKINVLFLPLLGPNSHLDITRKAKTVLNNKQLFALQVEICTYIHSFIHSYMHSFLHTFMHLFIYLSINLFIHSFNHLFILFFTNSLMHAFVHSFKHYLIYLFIRVFIYIFIHLFIYSFM